MRANPKGFKHGLWMLGIAMLSAGVWADEWAVTDMRETLQSADNMAGENLNLRFPHSAVNAIECCPSFSTYIADTDQHRIVYMTANRGGLSASVLAGSGVAGYSGDENIDPRLAQFTGPFHLVAMKKSVILTAQGPTVYVADRWNHVIRRINTTNRINGTQVIKVAGTGGVAGYSGDGGLATSATLNQPSGIALDYEETHLYIADSFNHRVRKLDLASGLISLVAGNGIAGNSGDGGLATEASLHEPTNLVVDLWGNVYVAEHSGHRIRKITPQGIISTVAGTGEAGFSGDGGAATWAQLNHPSGITVDDHGNLYIADTLNQRIRQVSQAGIITTIAGTGVAGNGITGNNGLGGNALEAEFNEPKSLQWWLSVSPSGYECLYVADKNNHTIKLLRRFIEVDSYIPTSHPLNSGTLATEDVWFNSFMPRLYEKVSSLQATWQKRSDALVKRGDRVVWGYFYADPNSVSWGSPDNPEVFVKIWQDISGRTDVNFFHVSVPDIGVSSAVQSAGSPQQDMLTLAQRYTRHYYQPATHNSAKERVATPEAPVTRAGETANAAPYAALADIRIGIQIETEENGIISGIWNQGGEQRTERGDTVLWGYFYANPADVSWGDANNPEVFVKIWQDVSGRIDVNFFHVSVPSIQVFSQRAGVQQSARLSLTQRYTRHEF